MSLVVMRINGEVSVRQTLCHLYNDEISSESDQMKQNEFEDKIKRIHGDSMSLPWVPPEE